MKKAYIDKLVRDYLEGLTDISQEMELKREILEHDKGAEYPELYGLFMYLERDREDVLSRRDVWNSSRIRRKPFKEGKARIYLMAVLSAAASVVLLVMSNAGVFSGKSGDFELIIGGDRVDDRELALDKNKIRAYYFSVDKESHSVKVEEQDVTDGIPFSTFMNAVKMQMDWDNL